MKYCNTLIAVKDMEQSLQFYKDLFDQEVAVDLGWCKTLTCGLTLQEHFDKVAGFLTDTMKYRSNTMELYFETENFDEFIALLDKYPEVERLHEPKTYSWLQRGIHIFDPNGHLIEVSESMYSVACKQFEQGKSVKETAELVMHPLNVVQRWYEEYQSQQHSEVDASQN
ncbi:MAG: glyoxalase/bleomycin resistance/dioxygenase family protein [Lachnospiraceae bacterium]|nr:glyoxalase/bleomycin resistance/dioxygenase family protein [Lachnospiraceae bacterium]